MQLNLARPVPDMRLDVVLMEGHLAAAPPRAPDTIYPNIKKNIHGKKERKVPIWLNLIVPFPL